MSPDPAGEWINALPLLLFAAIRPGAALLFTPGLAAASIPVSARFAVAVAVGCAGLPTAPAEVAHTLAAFGVLDLLREVVIGALIGMAAQLVVAAATIAGDMIANATGLSFAAAADPASGGHGAVLTAFLTQSANMLFVSAGGLSMVALALTGSFRIIPLTGGSLPSGAFGAVLELITATMTLGLLLGLPLTVAILFVNLASGLLSRAAPQLNLYAIGLPLTLFAGIGLLWMQLPRLLDAFLDDMARFPATIAAVLAP